MPFRWASEEKISGESSYLHVLCKPFLLDRPEDEGTKFLRNSGSLSVYRCVQNNLFPEELSNYQHLFENNKPGTELPPPPLCFLSNPYRLIESK